MSIFTQRNPRAHSEGKKETDNPQHISETPIQSRKWPQLLPWINTRLDRTVQK